MPTHTSCPCYLVKLSLPHKRHQPSSILPTISPRVEGVRIQDFFSVPTELKGVSGCECKKFKQIQVQQLGFECPHHLWVSPPLNLQSQNDKITFIGCHHLPKFWGKKTNVKWLISIFLQYLRNAIGNYSHNYQQNYTWYVFSMTKWSL